jgi:hypothetical protein
MKICFLRRKLKIKIESCFANEFANYLFFDKIHVQADLADE